MSNPISATTRGWLYTISVLIGILSVIAGPLMIALGTPADWQAVVVSTVGAVTTGLATLARANLPAPELSAEPFDDPAEELQAEPFDDPAEELQAEPFDES